MGTERDEIYAGPCRCGKSKIQIDHCCPDHAWPSGQRYWYECAISCSECNRLFEIQQRDRGFYYVERARIKELEALGTEAHKRGKQLLKQANVQKLLQAATALLEAQTSVAGVHRLLQAKGIRTSAIGTFRKRWRGAEDWLKENISHLSVDELLKLLGVKDSAVSEAVRDINDLLAASHVQPPTVNGPIYEFR